MQPLSKKVGFNDWFNSWLNDRSIDCFNSWLIGCVSSDIFLDTLPKTHKYTIQEDSDKLLYIPICM